MNTGAKMDGQHIINFLTWPMVAANITVIAWFQDLMNHFPGPTTIYTVVTTLFMVFQMADKLGWLDRFKPKKDA